MKNEQSQLINWIFKMNFWTHLKIIDNQIVSIITLYRLLSGTLNKNASSHTLNHLTYNSFNFREVRFHKRNRCYPIERNIFTLFSSRLLSISLSPPNSVVLAFVLAPFQFYYICSIALFRHILIICDGVYGVCVYYASLLLFLLSFIK